MRKILTKTLLLLSTLLMLAAPAIPVQADVAPPENPPIIGISPDQKTKVQMVAEEVVFDIPAKDEHTSVHLQMSAKFEMRNQGNESETMRVGFPEGCYSQTFEDSVTVNGQKVDVSEEEGEVIALDQEGIPCESNMWLRFDVTFPPQETVEIIVNQSSYLLPYGSYAYYSYILETGAGWYGPIGKGAIVFNLPYTANSVNFQGSWNSSLTLSKAYEKQSVRLTFNNLEPNNNHNLSFVIGEPYIWRLVDASLQNIQDHPRDPQAYAELGQAYSKAVRIRGGIDEAAVELAAEAYNHALRLDPYCVDAHVGIAETFFSPIVEYSSGDVDIYADPYKPALDHLAKALALDPTNEAGLELLHEVGDYTDKKIKLPDIDPGWFPSYLQPTPTGTPTQRVSPSNTYTLSNTYTPSDTPTATKTYTITVYQTRGPRPTKSPYHTFTPEPGRSTSTPEVLQTTAAPTNTVAAKKPSTSQQPTTQTRLVLYLILIALMGVAGFVMWRREQRK